MASAICCRSVRPGLKRSGVVDSSSAVTDDGGVSSPTFLFDIAQVTFYLQSSEMIISLCMMHILVLSNQQIA